MAEFISQNIIKNAAGADISPAAYNADQAFVLRCHVVS